MRFGQSSRIPAFRLPRWCLAASPVLHGAARAVVEAFDRHAAGSQPATRGRAPRPVDPDTTGFRARSRFSGTWCRKGSPIRGRSYHELARLAGALFYRDPQGRSAEEVPAYDHREPGPVFERLRELIIELSGIARREPVHARARWPARTITSRPRSPDRAKEPGTRFIRRAPGGRVDTEGADADAGVQGFEPDTHPASARSRAAPGFRRSLSRRRRPRWDRARPAPTSDCRTSTPSGGTHVLPAGELELFMLGAPADVKLNLVLLLVDAPAGS